MVTAFVKNENTWRARLPEWPAGAAKPIVNDAKTACMVAKAIRGRTKFEKRPTMKNTPDLINERIHLLVDPIEKHDKFKCAPITGITSNYCWRLERADPGFIHMRRRGCICTSCMGGKWADCKLMCVPGGPGPWVRRRLRAIVPRGVAIDLKQRREDRETFLSRLRKNRFIAVKLSEMFLGKPYGIAKVVKKTYEADRAVPLTNVAPGESALDICWWSKIKPDALEFTDSAQVQTVPVRNVCAVKIQFARSNRPGQRTGGIRERGTRELSSACDEKILDEIERMIEKVAVAPFCDDIQHPNSQLLRAQDEDDDDTSDEDDAESE